MRVRRQHARGIAVSVLLVASVIAGFGVASVAARPASGAPAGQADFGIYTPEEPTNGIAPVDALAQRLARPIDIVMWYQGWGSSWPMLDPSWVNAVLATGRKPLVTWEPWAPGDVTQPAYQLSRIADGAYDDYVRSWATTAAAIPGTIYLRPMHEMNGYWYPWGGTVNGNSAADFIRAWRHLHDIFVQAGATNVRWVWSPNAGDWPATDANRFEQYYPGDQYVDVLSLDGYNFGTSVPGFGWSTFDSIFGSAYARLAQLGPQPIWITETASAPEGGDKAAWIRDMFASIASYPRLAAVIWFNVNKERDWRVDSSPDSLAAFALPQVAPAPAPSTAPAVPPTTTVSPPVGTGSTSTPSTATTPAAPGTSGTTGSSATTATTPTTTTTKPVSTPKPTTTATRPVTQPPKPKPKAKPSPVRVQVRATPTRRVPMRIESRTRPPAYARVS
jgi:hypothetical protein